VCALAVAVAIAARSSVAFIDAARVHHPRQCNDAMYPEFAWEVPHFSRELWSRGHSSNRSWPTGPNAVHVPRGETTRRPELRGWIRCWCKRAAPAGQGNNPSGCLRMRYRCALWGVPYLEGWVA